MARTNSELTNSELLVVEQLDQLPNSWTNQWLAKVNWIIENRTFSGWGWGGAVDSVFWRTGVVTAQNGDYTTSQVAEWTNLYHTDARVTNNSAVAANTAKVWITQQQADAIVANTAKVGITTQQANDITANNAKVWITTQQSTDITTNNAKVWVVAWGTAWQILSRTWTTGQAWIDTPSGGGWASSLNYSWYIFSGTIDNNVFDVAMNIDWTRMFLMWLTTDSVYQYTLSTANDISTAIYDNVSFSVSSQEAAPWTIEFNNDWTRMYIGWNNERVYQYNLSTWFDLSTASYSWISLNTLTLVPWATTLRWIRFANGWTRLLFISTATYTVYQLNLSTAYDLSTATYSWNSMPWFLSNGGNLGGTYNGMWITRDWLKIIMCDTFRTQIVSEYTMTSPWDLSTATMSNSYTTWDGILYGMAELDNWNFIASLNSADCIVGFTLN